MNEHWKINIKKYAERHADEKRYRRDKYISELRSFLDGRDTTIKDLKEHFCYLSDRTINDYLRFIGYKYDRGSGLWKLG